MGAVCVPEGWQNAVGEVERTMVLSLQVSYYAMSINKIAYEIENRDEKKAVNESSYKAFFRGGNSTCRQHIRCHYTLYSKLCAEAGIEENHWAIPPKILKGKKAAESAGQQTLDKHVVVTKETRFSREEVMLRTAQFIVVGNHVREFQFRLRLQCQLRSGTPHG
jgi:hypothetical protein